MADNELICVFKWSAEGWSRPFFQLNFAARNWERVVMNASWQVWLGRSQRWNRIVEKYLNLCKNWVLWGKWTKSAVFRCGKLGQIHSECNKWLYHSIALETLYNFAFESVQIGRSVGSQIRGKVPGARAILRDFGVRTDFPAERFVTSNPTQKMKDRAL